MASRRGTSVFINPGDNLRIGRLQTQTLAKSHSPPLYSYGDRKPQRQMIKPWVHTFKTVYIVRHH